MQKTTSAGQAMARLVIAAGCAWLAFIAWRTYAGWPVVPLDIDGNDPAVRAAHQAAVAAHSLHALMFAGAGIVVVAVAVWAHQRR
jgi:hypothetical protein